MNLKISHDQPQATPIWSPFSSFIQDYSLAYPGRACLCRCGNAAWSPLQSSFPASYATTAMTFGVHDGVAEIRIISFCRFQDRFLRAKFLGHVQVFMVNA